MFRIALAGRPNVGKSSLFNRLLPRALSLVEDTPGVTRDWIEGTTTLGEYAVALVDTAGLQGELGRVRGGLEGDIQDYNLAACRVSDLIWFMVDARAGLLPEDETLARDLRRMDIPILLIANKCENRQESRAFGVEVLRLGFGEAVMVSAAHGLGIEDLVAETLEVIRGEIIRGEKARGEADTEQGTDEGAGESEGEVESEVESEGGAESEDESESGESRRGEGLKAVIGRPNVGKSTLVNVLLGQDRLLVSEVAGTTRDAITIRIDSEVGSLVDTAGLRRRSKLSGVLERLAGGRSIAALGVAEQVWLVVDATLGVDKQDLILASRVIKEGRALLVVVNKCDCLSSYDAARLDAEDRLRRSLPQARGVAVVSVSAKEGRGLETLLATAREVDVAWNRRISTAALNRWLRAAVLAHPPPLASGRSVRIKYITQHKARPPSFMLSCSGALPRAYVRYLEKGLREEFDLHGVPLRFSHRKSDNPYAR